ncbi:MAG TPA: helicase, partial [Microbacterium sp.]|nr:helicase [Microbacterium sp.]
MADGPLIVQSDRTVLLEVAHPDAENARHELAIFAELERAPEHIHTYRITRLGLWNARAAGHDAEDMLATLETWAKFPVPPSVSIDIRETVGRYGRLVIERDDEGTLILRSTDAAVLAEIARNRRIQPLLIAHPSQDTYVIDAWARGQIKQELLKIGWPAEDHAGFTPGTPHEIELHEDGWTLRPYQRKAVDIFSEGGSGVVVLPCGAGKTLVGAAAMADTKTTTLILVTNTVSARQWRDELLKRTSLTPEEIGEYSGQSKEVKPVTIATYQILTAKRKGEYAHLALLDALDWGLIVYDEVHLLPAPVFKLTADLQARRRLGLTATLVREDGREGDVFSLIGPKRFDAPWKEIEAQGFISPAVCYEVRIDLPASDRLEYAASADDERYRLAATAHAKIDVVRDLVAKHEGEQILVIG